MKYLPVEIWKSIIDFLSYQDLLIFRRTSAFFLKHITKEKLKEKLHEETTATINPEELIFYEGEANIWQNVFPQIPTKGVVGSFGADRVPDWNLFVVVNSDRNSIDVIHPRIRIDSDGRIMLGVDKLTETWENQYRCTCGTYYLCDGFCRCGASDRNAEAYCNTFKETKCRYKIKRYDRNSHYTFLQFETKDGINRLDIHLIN